MVILAKLRYRASRKFLFRLWHVSQLDEEHGFLNSISKMRHSRSYLYSIYYSIPVTMLISINHVRSSVLWMEERNTKLVSKNRSESSHLV